MAQRFFPEAGFNEEVIIRLGFKTECTLNTNVKALFKLLIESLMSPCLSQFGS
jgi:hypothetical protein